MDLGTKLKRALYNSPLQHTGGKIALIAILIGLFIYAFPSFQKYYFAQPLPMLAGVVVSSILYLPTVLVLYFLDRRERESKLLFWGTTLSVIFFFGPVASKTNNLFRTTGLSDWQFVGFVEETIKILPLVLLLVFVRPAVNGTRDGLIYGALGGLGFAILEAAAYFALLDYPKMGWSALFTNTIGRATILGTDIHILFAATIGAAIGYGMSTKVRWKGILAIVVVFLLVALTHNQQDHTIGKMITVVGAAGSGMIISTLLGFPMEQLDQMQGTPLNYLVVSLGSTINMLVINVVNLVILFIAVWKSGDTERRIVREQLKEEPAAVITPEEYAGVENERRLHLRRLSGYPSQVGRTIRNLQNELAFRKDFVLQQGGSLEDDPPAAALRQLIEAERVKAMQASNNLSYSAGRS